MDQTSTEIKYDFEYKNNLNIIKPKHWIRHKSTLEYCINNNIAVTPVDMVNICFNLGEFDIITDYYKTDDTIITLDNNQNFILVKRFDPPKRTHSFRILKNSISDIIKYQYLESILDTPKLIKTIAYSDVPEIIFEMITNNIHNSKDFLCHFLYGAIVNNNIDLIDYLLHNHKKMCKGYKIGCL